MHIGIVGVLIFGVVTFNQVHDGLDSSAHRPKYRGIVHAFLTISQEEGLRVLYKVSVLYKKHCFLCLLSKGCECQHDRKCIVMGSLLLFVSDITVMNCDPVYCSV